MGAMPTFAIRPLVINSLQLRVDTARSPTETERNVHSVHAQITHDTDLATRLDLALPIHGLVGSRSLLWW